ncbi:DUF1178 family protein [Sphingomonas changnyeongensis]|uniref:DUF1178 family protein n=1 Tax=Sphingomonas changnyeongensis TaxID=2698679 RepID=A0A7Z2NX64_9SPHN|nr:DUF1178 family protein [Sphingomonas changnyeongensis]QHL91000.1 DUF1178 family protein [Sphingomonas changnyeongensis]
MIVFDLKCAAGHVFEAWFGSSADYEAQRARALVVCPVCGDSAIDKAVMAPRIGSGAARAEPASPPVGDTAGPPDPKALLAALARAQARMLAGSEWVGARFAEEARAIHHGEAEERQIHGEASPDEARRLADEGIELVPLPLPVTPPDQRH